MARFSISPGVEQYGGYFSYFVYALPLEEVMGENGNTGLTPLMTSSWLSINNAGRIIVSALRLIERVVGSFACGFQISYVNSAAGGE